METNGILACVLAFLAAASLVFVFFGGIGGRAAPAGGTDADLDPRKRLPGLLKTFYPIASSLAKSGLGAWLAPDGGEKAAGLEKRIRVAGLEPLSPQALVCAQPLCGIAFGAVLALMLGDFAAPAFVGGFFMGWMMPASAVDSAAQKRKAEVFRTLPFAIDLIAAAMRSGSDFNDAVRLFVAESGGGVLSEEFSRMLKQIQMGSSAESAMLEMSARMGTKEFDRFAFAVAHSLETGSALSATLAMQGEDMRKARFDFAEQKAQRAPSLMILPVAVFIMPAVFVIVFVPVWLKIKSIGLMSMIGGGQ
jgi:Flp pilus assembly protein TadB